MSIVEFFNPYNIDHIKAWRYLNIHTHWPEGFIHKGITFEPTWQVGIAGKLASAYTELALNGSIIGMPPE